MEEKEALEEEWEEEPEQPGGFIENLEGILISLYIRRPMGRLLPLVRQRAACLPGGRGFVSGLTAAGRRMTRAWMLALCGAFLALFFALAGLWWGTAVACCLLPVAVAVGVSAHGRKKKALLVAYGEQEIRLFNTAGEPLATLPYHRLASVHVYGDLLSLCTDEKNWVLEAGAGENLREMRKFMALLAEKLPGKVYDNTPAENT